MASYNLKAANNLQEKKKLYEALSQPFNYSWAKQRRGEKTET